MKRFATKDENARRLQKCDVLERALATPPPFEWIVRYAANGQISRSLYHGCNDPEIIVTMATRHATERQIFRALAAICRDAARELGVPELARLLRWESLSRAPADRVDAPFNAAVAREKTRWGRELLQEAAKIARAAGRHQLREKAVSLVFEIANVVVLKRASPYTNTRFWSASGAVKHRYMRIWRRYFPAPTIAQVVRAP